MSPTGRKNVTHFMRMYGYKSGAASLLNYANQVNDWGSFLGMPDAAEMEVRVLGAVLGYAADYDPRNYFGKYAVRITKWTR